MSKEIVFTAIVDKDVADKFDKIAETNFRSRTAHLQFIIEREVSKNEA